MGIVESTRNQAFFGPEVPCSRGIAAITAGKEHLSMLSYFQLFPHITANIKVVPGNTGSSQDSSHRSEISQFILSSLSFTRDSIQLHLYVAQASLMSLVNVGVTSIPHHVSFKPLQQH